MQLVCLLSLMLISLCSKGSSPVYTHVTNLFDIKRGWMKAYKYKRTFSFYLTNFGELLKIESNLIVFGPKKLESFVWSRRRKENTVFIIKQPETLKDIWYAAYTQRIRQKLLASPDFQMKHYPQFDLEYYNPMIMSKLYFLDAALPYDKFNSDFFIWCDAGYNHIFSNSVVWPDNVMLKYYQLLQPQWIFFNYIDGGHFKVGYHNESYPYIGRKAERGEAILAGNFGGYIRAVRDVKSVYQNLLRITLENGDLNSDETVIALMYIKYTYLFPGSSHVTFDYYVDRIKINKDPSRAAQHPRLLSVKFGEDGSLLARDEKMLAKYEIQTIQIQRQKPLPKIFVIKSTLLASNQLQFYRSIFYRYIGLLVLILFFYIYVLRKASSISNQIEDEEQYRS